MSHVEANQQLSAKQQNHKIVSIVIHSLNTLYEENRRNETNKSILLCFTTTTRQETTTSTKTSD